MQNNNNENLQLKGLLSNIVGDESLTDFSVNQSHKEELARARNLISFFYKSIEKNMHNLNADDMPWGERESAVSVIAKLTQIMIRLVPLERKIRGLDNTSSPLDELDDEELLSEEDIEILSAYVSRQAGSKEQA